MNHNTRILGLLALPALLFAACAPEGQDERGTAGADAAEAPPTQRPTEQPMGEEPSLAEWDQNGDQVMDRTEFGAWAQSEGPFDDFIDDEGIVDFEAIQGELHSALDVDGDGTVGEGDWDSAMQDLFGSEPFGEWADWDIDADAELNEEEFRQGAEQHGLQDRMDGDGDGSVSQQEVQDFFFELFDENDDDSVDMNEWNSGRDSWLGDSGMM